MPFKRKLRRIVKSKLFDQVIMFAVFLSILTMVIEHHDQVRGKVFLSAYSLSAPGFYTF